MRSWMVFVVALAGCGFPTLPELPSDGRSEGSVDANVAGVDSIASVPPDAGPVCYGVIARVCFSSPPTGARVVSGTTLIDTSNPAMCDATHDHTASYCVIAGESFTIPTGATLRAFGDKPLLLISTTATFELSGVIDVGSKTGSNPGAGANALACIAGENPVGASGGAGGSFGGTGGQGKGVDGTGGVAASALTSFPTSLRGGCRGALGAGDTAGIGGNGGGAVAIVAPRIVITGQVNASGSGGHGGGTKKCGGGGGGSGGMIVLEAPTISMLPGPAQLFANGGGGGQGGATGVVDHAADGLESTGPFTPGIGGKIGSLPGGGGANGSSGATTLDGDDAANGAGPSGGGGGGGGASGFIRAPGVTSTNIAPASDPP